VRPERGAGGVNRPHDFRKSGKGLNNPHGRHERSQGSTTEGRPSSRFSPWRQNACGGRVSHPPAAGSLVVGSPRVYFFIYAGRSPIGVGFPTSPPPSTSSFPSAPLLFRHTRGTRPVDRAGMRPSPLSRCRRAMGAAESPAPGPGQPILPRREGFGVFGVLSWTPHYLAHPSASRPVVG